MSIIGNANNIHIAKILGVLRVSNLDGKTYYDGEDYCHDLNAMHEAEKILTYEQQDSMARLVGRHDTWHLLHATAEQRAEAFIRVMD